MHQLSEVFANRSVAGLGDWTQNLGIVHEDELRNLLEVQICKVEENRKSLLKLLTYDKLISLIDPQILEILESTYNSYAKLEDSGNKVDYLVENFDLFWHWSNEYLGGKTDPKSTIIKSSTSLFSKTRRYNWKKIVDITRATVVVDKIINSGEGDNASEKRIKLGRQLGETIKYISTNLTGLELKSIRPKIKYSGYSDITLVYMDESGNNYEIQLNSSNTLVVKEGETQAYNKRKLIKKRIVEIIKHVTSSSAANKKQITKLSEVVSNEAGIDFSVFAEEYIVGKDSVYQEVINSLQEFHDLFKSALPETSSSDYNYTSLINLMTEYSESLADSRIIYGKNSMFTSKEDSVYIIEAMKLGENQVKLIEPKHLQIKYLEHCRRRDSIPKFTEAYRT